MEPEETASLLSAKGVVFFLLRGVLAYMGPVFLSRVREGVCRAYLLRQARGVPPLRASVRVPPQRSFVAVKLAVAHATTAPG